MAPALSDRIARNLATLRTGARNIPQLGAQTTTVDAIDTIAIDCVDMLAIIRQLVEHAGGNPGQPVPDVLVGQAMLLLHDPHARPKRSTVGDFSQDDMGREVDDDEDEPEDDLCSTCWDPRCDGCSPPDTPSLDDGFHRHEMEG